MGTCYQPASSWQSTSNERDRRRGARCSRTIAAAGFASILALGGVFAYLTATDTAVNKFTLADSTDYQDKIHVVEASWNATDNDNDGIPDAAEGMVPGQSIAKDPSIRNDSSIESWAIMNVSVPTLSVQLEGEQSPALHELFVYRVNAGWTEVGTASYDAESNATVHTYIADDTLKASSSTPTLFDSVTLANLADGQLDASQLAQHIDCTGHAIQALGFTNGTDAWNAYKNQNAPAA